MVLEERPPCLRRWLWMAWPVLGHGRLRDLEAEHPDLTVDSGSAPQRILPRHSADKPTDFARHWRSSRLPPSRLPAPETSETLSMPAITVSGLTITRISLQPDHSRDRTTQKRRSVIRSDGLALFRSNATSCCRRARFSRCNIARLRKASRTMARTIRMVVHMSETLSGTSRKR